ncbi:bacteriorhodopsin [Halorubellus salinus]|uniref:bacteriorhodopsin n=1 Tax=Halorubellus salinus TaxID=755309 RepID=UPI001D06C881|nr:bacteriorhodopsin [Halorubellus salinus]
MDVITIYYLVGLAGMTIGTLAFSRAFLNDARNRTYHALLVGIAGIAAVMYALMAVGVGRITVDGVPVELARYAQWLLATPLIVVYLGLLAGLTRRYIATLVGLDVLVMASGLAAALSDGLATWAFFGVGSVAYLPLIYGLTIGLTDSVATRPSPVVGLFRKLRNLTIIIWTFYPILWVLAPTGVGLISREVEILLITYADVIAKVVFGFIALRSQASLARLPNLDAVSALEFGNSEG